MEKNVENKELISKIEEILRFPLTLKFNTDNKTFFGYCSARGRLFNDFHINVLESSCELKHELLDINVRSDFIRWFNLYGGNNAFMKEAVLLSEK